MRLWKHYGDDPGEPDALEQLIAQRLREMVEREAGDREAIERLLRAHAAFLQYRFGAHLRNYRSFAGKYAFAFTILSLITVGSGLTSSGIAAGWNGASWARFATVGLGLAVGIAGVLTQVWSPKEKAISRMRGANGLAAEAWMYIERRGRYSNVDDEKEAFGEFVDEVSRIVAQTALVDEARGSAPS